MEIPGPDAPLNLASLRFQTLLGAGAFGLVFKTVDHNTRTETAVKIIFPSPGQNLREANITRDLPNLQNVVRIFGVLSNQYSYHQLVRILLSLPGVRRNTNAQGLLSSLQYSIDRDTDMIPTTFIQQELCGENLREWLNKDHNPDLNSVQNTQVTIVNNIIIGLKSLHNNGIIHRDLNPNNILFSGPNFQPPLKIGDLGLSRLLHSGGALSINVGTPSYMAPEILGGNYTLQADLFSLGFVIWEVASLIGNQNRVSHFTKYKIHNNTDIITCSNPQMPGVKQLILHLTQTRTEDRIRNIVHVEKVVQSWTSNLFQVDWTEFNLLLQHVQPGNTINVTEGIYEGSTTLLRMNNVTIVGQGFGVCVRGGDGPCLEIVGDFCAVSNFRLQPRDGCKGMKVTGSGNGIRNVQFMGGNCCLSIRGNTNKLEDLHISRTETGIAVCGSGNLIDRVRLEQVAFYGIYLTSNSSRNIISNVSGDGVEMEIRASRSRNTLTNISFRRGVVNGNL